MTLKSWLGWSWWSNTNHHQLRQHCAATTEACKRARSASPQWCIPSIAVPASDYNTSKTQVQDVCNNIHINLQPICVVGGRKTDWNSALQAQMAWSHSLVSTQGFLHKWLQARLFSDTHCQLAPNKSWQCSSSSFSGAFATAQGGHGGLYSAAVAQEDIMQGAEEEGLPPSNGF